MDSAASLRRRNATVVLITHFIVENRGSATFDTVCHNEHSYLNTKEETFHLTY